jgi:hypothetical protein
MKNGLCSYRLRPVAPLVGSRSGRWAIGDRLYLALLLVEDFGTSYGRPCPALPVPVVGPTHGESSPAVVMHG